MRGDRLDKESKAYADAAIPAIAAWSEKELLDRQSPELKQTLTQQQLDLTFQRLSLALGHLQKCEPAQGQSIMSGKQVKATYISKAIFEKGEAVIQLDLINNAVNGRFLGLKVIRPCCNHSHRSHTKRTNPSHADRSFGRRRGHI